MEELEGNLWVRGEEVGGGGLGEEGRVGLDRVCGLW